MIEDDGAPIVRRSVVILNNLGLHLRPADLFVRLAQQFAAEIMVCRDGRAVDGKSILSLATLAAECGTRLDLEACGPDAEAALDALAGLVAARFHEENERDAPRGGEPTVRPPVGGRVDPVAKGVKVLIVDDDPGSAGLVERLLSLAGHEVATAQRGAEAIETARQFRPQFVLLDIGPPSMCGHEVAPKLKRVEGCENVAIIAVSGYVPDEHRRRPSEAGLDHCLTKPLDCEALLSLLSTGAAGMSSKERRGRQ